LIRRILIAEDHDVLRRALRAILESRPSWRVVAEAVNGHEAVERAELLKPDVAILDVAMPQMDGLAAARRIREKVREVQLLITSHHDSPEIIRQAFNAGVDGFVAKVDIASELIPAIQTVCAGRPFLSRSVRHSAPPNLGLSFE